MAQCGLPGERRELCGVALIKFVRRNSKMKKIKKPVSILIVFMMIVSVFTILPISASAAILTGTVDMSELQVGDVIKSDVTITNNNGYSIKLPSGKIYCDDSMEILDHDVVLKDFSILYNSYSIKVKDNTAEPTYYPIDQYGFGGGEAFVVTAVDSATSIVTIETPIIYNVSWENYDGRYLEVQNAVEGEIPSYNGVTPKKPVDAKNAYTFVGWSPEISAVTADVTYTAQYTASPIPEDYESPALSSLWVGDSGEVTSAGVISGTGGTGTATVTQEGDYTVLTLDNFTYKGEGHNDNYQYSNTVSPIYYYNANPLIIRLVGTNEITQTGVTNGNSFGIYTFLSSDVTIEGTGSLSVSSGSAPSNSKGIVINEGMLTISECTLNVYGASAASYKCDAINVAGRCTIKNGAKLTAVSGPTANKGLGVNTFSFGSGGAKNLIIESGTVSLSGTNSAIYYYGADDCALLQVADGSTLKELKAGNSEAAAADVTLDSIANQKYIYAEVEGSAKTYTITWKNYDNTVIGTSKVEDGETPAFSDTIGEIKDKPEDDDYTYTFSGWTPEIVAAEGDAEYTAAFNSTDKKVAAVVAMFNALPDPENVTVDDKDAIEAAGYALAALTNAQKALIAPADIARYRAIAEAFAVVDQAAAEGVTYLINQIPAEVTENDKEAVENARKAYEMLTDAQKALLSADTLAKLEAAEAALIPALVNESEILTTNPMIGEKISVKGAASGGAGDYTYAFYYKKTAGSTWYKIAEPYTTNRAAFKPAATVSYDVKVIAKDAAGNTEEKIITIKVNGPLVNKSEILTTEPKVDEKVRVKGAASGGAGDYTYAFYYKKSSKAVWYKIAEPYTTKTAAFKPTSAISYDIKVVVNDTEGRTAEQIYTVDVAK